MRLLQALVLAAPLTAASNIPLLSSPPQQIFSNAPSCSENENSNRIPTSYESAVLARRILQLTPLGTLSTIFPSNSHSNEHRPSGLENTPIGLMDYIADCESVGNPNILAIRIATSFKNVDAGSNISISLSWTPPYPPSSRIGLSSLFSSQEKDLFAFSAANLPRFSLSGYLEAIPVAEAEEKGLKECFVKTHQDAKYWLPGNRIHTSEWTRLVVTQIYWVGGFGDRAYIGWIPVEEYANVTKEEWESVRLPGEKKGWKEWAVDSFNWDL